MPYLTGRGTRCCICTLLGASSVHYRPHITHAVLRHPYSTPASCRHAVYCAASARTCVPAERLRACRCPSSPSCCICTAFPFIEWPVTLAHQRARETWSAPVECARPPRAGWNRHPHARHQPLLDQLWRRRSLRRPARAPPSPSRPPADPAPPAVRPPHPGPSTWCVAAHVRLAGR